MAYGNGPNAEKYVRRGDYHIKLYSTVDKRFGYCWRCSRPKNNKQLCKFCEYVRLRYLASQKYLNSP